MAGVKDGLTNLIFSDKVANSLLLSTTHTRSLGAVLSAKFPDSLSQQWEQFKCYL